MFQELIEDVLEFIALHGEGGCDGSSLCDFVSRDVLPHYGLPGGAPLQEMVIRRVAADAAAASAIAVHRAGEAAAVPLAELARVAPGARGSCTVRPALALQERVLGVSLRRSKLLRDAVNCACAHFVDGLHRHRPAPRDRRSSAGANGSGVRRLLREQFLRVAYTLDPAAPGGSALLVPTCYPHFATPTAAATRARRPMDAYIARRRAERLPGRVHFDLRVVREVVAAAPERRLVYEDAVHAILAAHGLEDSKTWAAAQGKRLQNSLKRMLRAAGLRIVHARLLSGRYRRKVRVVVLSRDASSSAATPVARGDAINEDHAHDKEGDEHNPTTNDGEEEEEEEDEEDEEELDAKDEDAHHAGDEESEDGEDSEADGADTAPPFAIDPSLPLPLQVVKEAERGPLSIVSILPRIVFFDVRLLDKELLRYTKNYETRWGTIMSTRVRSPHSKAFTILLRPAGSDVPPVTATAHTQSAGSFATMGSDTAPATAVKGSSGNALTSAQMPPLPRGVTHWSVDRVLDALRASPRGVLSLPVLARVVDRTTLNRRLLPFLRSAGIVTTTGATAPNGLRVGIVALAGADLSDEARAVVVRECAQYLADRQRRESPVVLHHIPAATGRVSERCERLVARAVVVRNGFARNGTARAARLHAELWRVWYALGAAPATVLSLDRVLDELSLGAFCVVAGLAGVDAGAFVRDGSAAWGTPLRLLPPTLRGHCRGASPQPLLHALGVLQRHRLIAAAPPLAAYTRRAVADVPIALCERGGDGRGAAEFWCGATGARGACRAVLRYWAERLSGAATPLEHQRAAPLLSEAAATEPDMTTLQLVALAHALRIDVAALAEYVTQRRGAVPAARRGLLDALRPAARPSPGGAPPAPLPAAPLPPPRARAVRRRFELSGASVAEALDAALQSADAAAAVTRIGAALRRLPMGRVPLPAAGERTAPGGSRAHAGALQIVRAVEAALRGGAATAEAITSVATPNFAVPADCSAPTLPSDTAAPQAEAVEAEPPEALQDAMRMILLSDEAHYDAAAAKAVLAPYDEAARRHCARWLAQRPAFRSGGSATSALRIGGVDVSPVLSLSPSAVIAAATHDSSATAAFSHSVAAALLSAPPSRAARTALPQWDFADDPALSTSVAPSFASSSASSRAPSVLAQPTLDLNSLSAEIRQQRGLGVLRLPRLAWPVPRSPPSRDALPPAPAAAAASSSPRPAGRRAEPHPARAVLRAWRRVERVGLGDIPADPLPGGPPPPSYPSVFHHVDGAFHEFLWRAFLVLAYALVQHQPGIAREELTQRMAASGVASVAACQKVLDFLTASLVLVKRRVVEETQRSPFAVAAEPSEAAAFRECYFCTLPQDGPWRILEL